MRRCHINTLKFFVSSAREFSFVLSKWTEWVIDGAKVAAQEAGKHAYATYVAIEAVAKRFLTQRYA